MEKKQNKGTGLWRNIKQILGDTWQFDRGLFGLTAAFMVSTAVVGLSEVYIIKFLVDELMGLKRPQALVIMILAAALLLLFAKLIISFVNSKHWYRLVMVRIQYIFKRSKKLMEMPFQATEDPEVQDMLEESRWAVQSAISASGAGIEIFLKTILLGFFAQIPLILSYVGIIASFSPALFFIIVLTVIVEYLLNVRLSKEEHKMREEASPAMRRMNYFNDAMADAKFGSDIRIYSLSGILLAKYQQGAIKQIEVYSKFIGKQVVVNLSSLLISTLRYGIISVFLFFSVKDRGLSIGDYSMLLAAAIAFSTGMSAMVFSAADLIKENLSVGKYFKFMELEIGGKEGQAEVPKEEEYSLEFRNVSFSYPGSKEKCIDDFSLKIAPRERLALVGINGAGKTTLIKLLTGLYRPSFGQILLNGRDITEFKREEWFKLFSVVLQDINMFAWGFGENVSLSKKELIDRAKLEKAVEDAGLTECVKALPKGYDNHILRVLDEDGVELSGGQAQRLALARAIYKDGRILILDEPTSALDPMAESRIYESFDRLMKGKTGIYVSHRLSSTRFCDKIVFMEGGRLLEYGSHRELMALKGGYANMFEKQSHYYQEEGEL